MLIHAQRMQYVWYVHTYVLVCVCDQRPHLDSLLDMLRLTEPGQSYSTLSSWRIPLRNRSQTVDIVVN